MSQGLIKERANVDFLRGKADIAVVGTEVIHRVEEMGVASVGDFIRSLSPVNTNSLGGVAAEGE